MYDFSIATNPCRSTGADSTGFSATAAGSALLSASAEYPISTIAIQMKSESARCTICIQIGASSTRFVIPKAICPTNAPTTHLAHFLVVASGRDRATNPQEKSRNSPTEVAMSGWKNLSRSAMCDVGAMSRCSPSAKD